jgi:hypothetical protein
MLVEAIEELKKELFSIAAPTTRDGISIQILRRPIGTINYYYCFCPVLSLF